ncbi:hypothetical protein AALP_AA3G050800 [Arabis alpina]|uniref:PWWP domain-containing protein n=1 Tax=Arabis alpina TaxID=50452 RepID=A0A087H748_ARAAL|nr:hypothetical protein AALP_AA3G050800 [Arabis alpina]
MLLHAKDKGLKMVTKMDSALDTKINPRVFVEDSDYQFHELNEEADEKKKMGMEEQQIPEYNTLLTEFDDYVSKEKIDSRVSRALSYYGFEMGDLVWGKVKSHPWWPGRIFNEVFVSPSVRSMKKMGYVLVAFFGDNSYGWFDPAELIPFEPHVKEKSHQTNSSNFVKALEEAKEEACRMSALGLICKCRNPHNFRDSNVQGYFVVDVPGYEFLALYSSKQIMKARESFSSGETLDFVKRCALAPLECDSESVQFFQKKAVVFAFRRAVFEEFDETYEQAFKASSAYVLVKTQEPFTKTPSRETLGDPKSYTHAMQVKESIKQDKDLPRRREEAGDMIVQFGQVQASSQLQGINGFSARRDHVLPRRTPYLQTPMKHEQTGLLSINSSGDFPGKESSFSEISRDDDKVLAQDTKGRMGEKGTHTHFRSNKGKCSAGVGYKKVNDLKRSSGEMNYANGPKKKMKKKKEPRSELNCGNPDKRKASSFVEASAKQSSQLDAAERHSNKLTVRNSKLDVLQLLSDFQALSLDPFFGSSDRSSIKAVRQFFLRFRSFAYQKSLAKSPFATKPSESAKTLSSTNESSKAGEKRFSSDHQQDIPSTKKLKFKPMGSDKKTNQEAKKSSNLAPLNPVRDQGGPGLVPINAKAQPGKKKAPSAKIIEPTMLVMKFPSSTSLPSAALLKARFSRFGPLDHSATRVIWKSSICRVVFLYKLDAQTALRYASGSNSLFGNANVMYFLRDAKASSASGDHELKKAKTIIEPLSQRLERALPVHKPNIQLKSCLKTPGNGNRRTARVKFMLGGKETRTTIPVSGSNNASSSIAMEFVSKNTQNITVPSTLPPILPLSSQNSKPKHVNNSNQVGQIEPPLDQSVDISEEMVKLLLRCNDVVTNVTGLLGYVPYHTL